MVESEVEIERFSRRVDCRSRWTWGDLVGECTVDRGGKLANESSVSNVQWHIISATWSTNTISLLTDYSATSTHPAITLATIPG